MLPELGQISLILALQLALLQSVLSLAGVARQRPAWMAMARGAGVGQLLFLSSAFLILAWSFFVCDFSVVNVAEHASRRLPTAYRLAATWGSHEGSMLLWALILAGWGAAVIRHSHHLPADLAARVIGVMGLVSTGLLAFILFTSNPFLRLDPAPPEGLDLNPLLQDPGMVLHPPLLYMGYVGFSVAFAFAIAALLAGRLDAAWARWSRPWTIVAWLFLTLGIMVGSWWAYYELGWGGWWFWDPTENASLMPWLAGTALLHSLAVTDKRGSLRVWTVFLAISAFSLSLVGTFLVRSGVLSSIHAFAQDPLRGLFILAFLALVIGSSLALFAWRAPAVVRSGGFELCSRESLILSGNVLLVVALGTVKLGTLYPLVLDALDLGRISVGPPYFNAVFIPIMAPVVALAGLGPALRWRQAAWADALPLLRWPLLAALVLGLGLPSLVWHFDWQACAGASLALWLMFVTVLTLRTRRRLGGTLPLHLWGMGVAHIGLSICVMGISVISSYASERDVSMATGDSAILAGYTFTLKAVKEENGPNFTAQHGYLEISRNGALVGTLEPEKRVYAASRMPMTEAAIRYGLFADLYVALGQPLPGGRWGVRLFHKPFASWLWAGALGMALGALLAALDRRYRRHSP